MTFRVGCMVTCEDIPRAAKIPPASNATATNPIRRFIVSSSTQILMDCVKSPTARPRECNTQCFLRQARPRSSCRSTTKNILLDVIFRLRGFSGGKVFRTGRPWACSAFPERGVLPATKTPGQARRRQAELRAARASHAKVDRGGVGKRQPPGHYLFRGRFCCGGICGPGPGTGGAVIATGG